MSDYLRTPKLEIVRAEASEAEAVRSILVEAAEWHQSQHFNQWFPDLFTQILRDRIDQQIQAGEVYLARISDEPVGTLTLQWSDEEVWGPDAHHAGYVHRLAVRRAWSGRSIGRAMLDWASEQCANEGKSYLRLDTMSTNLKLRAYYERLGFVFQRINPVPVWKPALYERAVAFCSAD